MTFQVSYYSYDLMEQVQNSNWVESVSQNREHNKNALQYFCKTGVMTGGLGISHELMTGLRPEVKPPILKCQIKSLSAGEYCPH